MPASEPSTELTLAQQRIAALEAELSAMKSERDTLREAYTAVFNAANAEAGIGWLTVVLLQWHQGIKLGVFPEGHSHLDPTTMAEAWARGAQTTTDIYDAGWDWMALLDLPLDDVRAALAIPAGGRATVSPGGSWNGEDPGTSPAT